MLMHHNQTFVAVVTLLGIMASLGWFTTAQAGGGGERRVPACFPVVSSLPKGGEFIGEILSLNLAVDEEGQLQASGVLFGNVTVHGATQQIAQMFDGVGVELRQAGRPKVCANVTLDFDPIYVDSLKLDVESQITRNSAPPRTCGFLLRPLLCLLAGLLNSSSPNEAVIQQLLDIINSLS
jgi:hypothetical protein